MEPHQNPQLRESRSLTSLGLQQFESMVAKHVSKLSCIKRDIDSLIMDIDENPVMTFERAKIFKSSLTKLMLKYDKASAEFASYLQSQRHENSLREESSRSLINKTLQDKVRIVLKQLDDILPKPGSQKSERTYKTTSSSHLTAVMLEHTAKVEEARARMRYAEEEAELMKKEADLKAARCVLTVKREYDAAQSSLRAIKRVFDFSDNESLGGSFTPDKFEDIDYLPRSSIKEHNTETSEHNMDNPIQHLDIPSTLEYTEKFVRDQTDSIKPSILNPEAPVFVQQTNSVSSDTHELAKLLAKKQLLPARLTTFDDIPGHYYTWKSTFENVMSELGASPLERLDLLIQNLGTNSKRQAMNIRSANPNEPSRALILIWERLDSRFGSPESIESSLKDRVSAFPVLKNTDRSQLFELSDLLMEIDSIKRDERFSLLFAYYDSSTGINPIVRKLPYSIQEKWTNEANRYKEANKVTFPPFSLFVSFIQRTARIRNDPGFVFDNNNSTRQDSDTRTFRRPVSPKAHISTRKTEVKSEVCPIHGTNHTLNMCRQFRSKPLTERRNYIRDNGYCFKCCGQKKHLGKTCKETVRCEVCRSSEHPSALHSDPRVPIPQRAHEGENDHATDATVFNKCTKICKVPGYTSKSCAKIVLVRVYPHGQRHHCRVLYCMIDDQSNRSLAVSKFFDAFGEHGKETEYVLSSCAGRFNVTGRRASGYVVESLDGSCALKLPNLIECNDIPNNREEIPSPAAARNFPHLKGIASSIPGLNEQADIELLIGRDLITAHHVLEQRIGKDDLPYGQRLPLGWVVIGNVCLGKVHGPDIVNVNKTAVLSNGRPTLMRNCENKIYVDMDPVFKKTEHDEKPGLSIEDQRFLDIMDAGFQKTQEGQWMAPLPFRENRMSLPNNKEAALRRARSFDASIQRNAEKRQHVVDFMQKLFDNNHAETAPDLVEGSECWYLPLFGVYHPKKPESIRIVFDSSARFLNVSLNDVMLKGPDLSNSLLGILLRFRKEAVAVTMDVEQMFYNFKVTPEHRNFLRFLWHENNDPDRPLTDYQMTVHVFGNSPSPSVATYGLRKAVESASADVKDLVINNFYVDDGLLSCTSEEEAVSLVHRTKDALSEGGALRLHKFTSNRRAVLDSFDQSDLAKNLKDLDLGTASLPLQRSLGLLWDTDADIFLFKVSSEEKPYTKRGVLSVINSIYDPIGFAQPVIIKGKLLLRNMMSSPEKSDWDDPLPEALFQDWKSWVRSLTALENLRVPRQYSSLSFKNATRRKVHIYADASKEAIAAVAFLQLFGEIPNTCTSSFLIGKAKVAPTSGHTIPRLELCAAVMAVQLGDTIREQLQIDREHFSFYTDSQVVLGYVTNESRRFHVYVGNRVSRIRMSSEPSQWSHVSTELNPADVATRSIPASMLPDSLWIKGPKFLLTDTSSTHTTCDFPLIDPTNDKEVKPEIHCCKTEKLTVSESTLGAQRFTRFLDWERLVNSIAYLKTFLRKRKCGDNTDTTLKPFNQSLITETERLIIHTVQMEAFGTEIQAIKEGKSLKGSSVQPLCPILGPDGLLRVGGRLRRAQVGKDFGDLSKHPIIIPKNSHLAKLLILHFHKKVAHQGRHFTEGAVRAAGFWVVAAKRLIMSEISKCVICRMLRGKLGWQQMADLPEDRVRPSPPFSFVGVDTFGPWPIIYRRTRGGAANQKRWALLFTCLVTRAIHIEVIEELSSAAFINALRRFVAIRGPVVQFRSDRGTNFIGATENLSINAEFVERGPVQTFLSKSRTSWKFNPPHASHMGGAWERLIGVSRKILDSMLLRNRAELTHDVLVTLMAEVCAIVNNRPLLPVSTDPEAPSILTPATLLTMKTTSDVCPFPNFESKEMIRSHWKRVQGLADEFWKRWKMEYLQTLQVRKKWQEDHPNLKPGDVVLMKDRESARNDWPLGIITKAFKSEDGKVRKVELDLMKNGERVTYVRPISELVTLLEV